MKWAIVVNLQPGDGFRRFSIMNVPDEVKRGDSPNKTSPLSKIAYVFEKKTQVLFDTLSLFADGGVDSVLHDVVWGFNEATLYIELGLSNK